MGGFIIDQFTWRQQRGLNPLHTKRPTGKALSLPQALPHAPISAFCSTRNCVFTSIVANGWGHQKPASPVSDSAGEHIGGELGAPALRSVALSGLWLAHSPLSKECKPPQRRQNRLWLNLGWTFPPQNKVSHKVPTKSGVFWENNHSLVQPRKGFEI